MEEHGFEPEGGPFGTRGSLPNVPSDAKSGNSSRRALTARPIVMSLRVVSGGLKRPWPAAWRSWNGSATASGSGLYGAPTLTGLQHGSDAGIARDVLDASLVSALGLCLGLSLSLPAATIVVILARHCGEHVEQHAGLRRASRARIPSSTLRALAISHAPDRALGLKAAVVLPFEQPVGVLIHPQSVGAIDLGRHGHREREGILCDRPVRHPGSSSS